MSTMKEIRYADVNGGAVALGLWLVRWVCVS